MSSSKLTDLPAGSAVTASDLFYSAQGATSVKVTGTQLAAFVGSGGGGITDAPSDNDTYARENAAWKKIPTITVTNTAPSGPAVGDVWIDTT